ncbi:hypothetical protein H310_08536 [Aphanomyces invadans]|uniref:Uncharacterized protein n=1 Tax=Aphanomyces invadans TaxID=157072 RepID=A0A024U0I4_9STRA|nr:hypothetical protein H310_08536 [Aphanomyces invadans]ETV99127.1 hypothetical protein H310_08536 [Aphanomyces invadans]|eukprot:XP_008872555.1 hypothetical protein H310_08536 [Aphanomyces invadans]
MNDALLCKYAYKPCANPRVAKKDGDLHRLCEYHRDKANAIQKIYATRRRRERRAERRRALMQKLLGNIEPVPFDPDTQRPVRTRTTTFDYDQDILDAEMAGLLDWDDAHVNHIMDDDDLSSTSSTLSSARRNLNTNALSMQCWRLMVLTTMQLRSLKRRAGVGGAVLNDLARLPGSKKRARERKPYGTRSRPAHSVDKRVVQFVALDECGVAFLILPRSLPMDESLCKYAYKPCQNPRVAKKDGGLHRLCAFHRDKANAVQKIYATRRRRERCAERRANLVQTLLDNIEPFPFDRQTDQLTQDERSRLEAELAALLEDDGNAAEDDVDDVSIAPWSQEYPDDRLSKLL